MTLTLPITERTDGRAGWARRRTLILVSFSTRANAGSPTIVHVLLSESPFFFSFLISQSCVWQVGEEEKERNNHYTTITYTSNNTGTEIYGLPTDRIFVLCELRPIATIYIPGYCTITTKALGVHQVACQPTLTLPSSKSPPSEDWGAALLAGVSISITMGRPSVSLKHPSISSITRLLQNGYAEGPRTNGNLYTVSR